MTEGEYGGRKKMTVTKGDKGREEKDKEGKLEEGGKRNGGRRKRVPET